MTQTHINQSTYEYAWCQKSLSSSFAFPLDSCIVLNKTLLSFQLNTSFMLVWWFELLQVVSRVCVSICVFVSLGKQPIGIHCSRPHVLYLFSHTNTRTSSNTPIVRSERDPACQLLCKANGLVKVSKHCVCFLQLPFLGLMTAYQFYFVLEQLVQLYSAFNRHHVC